MSSPDPTMSSNNNMTTTTTSTGNVARLRNYSTTAANILKNRDWTGTLRYPQTFLGITSTTGTDQTSSIVAGWNVPKGKEIGPRLTKNASFFATNYAAFSAALMTYEILSDWTVLLWLVGVFGIWTFVIRAAAAGQLFPLVVQGVTIEKNKLYVGMSVMTSLILTYYVGSTFLFVTGCTMVFALLHSTFRNPLSYKIHDSTAQNNEFNGIESGIEMSGDNL